MEKRGRRRLVGRYFSFLDPAAYGCEAAGNLSMIDSSAISGGSYSGSSDGSSPCSSITLLISGSFGGLTKFNVDLSSGLL